MNRKLVVLLVLIGLAVVAMLLNTRDSVTLNLAFTTVSMRAAFAYLSFTAVGVLIGVLLR